MNEKIERLKAELVVFKGLMSDVSGVAVTLGIMTSLFPSCQTLHSLRGSSSAYSYSRGWLVCSDEGYIGGQAPPRPPHIASLCPNRGFNRCLTHRPPPPPPRAPDVCMCCSTPQLAVWRPWCLPSTGDQMDLAVPTQGTSGSGSPPSCRVSLLSWGWLVCASSWPSGALLSDRPWVETAVSRGGLLESRTLSFLPSSGSGQSARRAHPKEKEPECGDSAWLSSRLSGTWS